jgi:hypothetical protein
MHIWNCFDGLGLKRALKKYLNHPSIFLFLSMLRVRPQSMRLNWVDPRHLALIRETGHLCLETESLRVTLNSC